MPVSTALKSFANWAFSVSEAWEGATKVVIVHARANAAANPATIQRRNNFAV